MSRHLRKEEVHGIELPSPRMRLHDTGIAPKERLRQRIARIDRARHMQKRGRQQARATILVFDGRFHQHRGRTGMDDGSLYTDRAAQLHAAREIKTDLLGDHALTQRLGRHARRHVDELHEIAPVRATV